MFCLSRALARWGSETLGIDCRALSAHKVGLPGRRLDSPGHKSRWCRYVGSHVLVAVDLQAGPQPGRTEERGGGAGQGCPNHVEGLPQGHVASRVAGAWITAEKDQVFSVVSVVFRSQRLAVEVGREGFPAWSGRAAFSLEEIGVCVEVALPPFCDAAVSGKACVLMSPS